MKDFNDERIVRMIEHRPQFPKRAVVTGGMPYGNKELHFGHACGMYVYADYLARFLRDRLGDENVLFVSGTDCYGSPAMESYRKKVEDGFEGSIEDFVGENHKKQKATCDKYQFKFNYFGASGFGRSAEIHKEVSKYFFDTMYKDGNLSLQSTAQFFDKEKNTFLNGRQVLGKCPIEGCQSEKGYADECDLGHQYLPKELIDPVSTLSGTKPILKDVNNWYFSLDSYIDLLKEWLEYSKQNGMRDFAVKELKEFLKKPEVYIKKDYVDDFNKIKTELPAFTEKQDNDKTSFTIVFDKLADRETACDILVANNIRFRKGKTMVPFRLSGNIKWGVPVPEVDGIKDLTFYVWPESLWAPISFTQTYLDGLGKRDTWTDWWCSKDSYVYQILGEDNMYFYGPAQHAMWLSTQGKNPMVEAPEGSLQMSHLIVNKFSLFLGKKASSSGSIKPPMADDLLNYYTPEQLRAHFLGFSVGNNSASFMPKPYNPDAKTEDLDPVVKEGNLLTNVFNRICRTLFYTWQKDFNGFVPIGEVSESVVKDSTITILKWEKLMYDNKFHMTMYELDNYIRNINKTWVNNIKEIEDNKDIEKEKQLIIDTLYMVKVAMVLGHPLAPEGMENLADYLMLDKKVFSWNGILDPIYDFVNMEEDYKPRTLEPREDFFKKHPSQFE